LAERRDLKSTRKGKDHGQETLAIFFFSLMPLEFKEKKEDDRDHMARPFMMAIWQHFLNCDVREIRVWLPFLLSSSFLFLLLPFLPLSALTQAQSILDSFSPLRLL